MLIWGLIALISVCTTALCLIQSSLGKEPSLYTVPEPVGVVALAIGILAFQSIQQIRSSEASQSTTQSMFQMVFARLDRQHESGEYCTNICREIKTTVSEIHRCLPSGPTAEREEV